LHRHKTWPAVVWLGIGSLLVLLGFLGASQGSGSDGGDVLFDVDLAIGGVIFYGLMIAISFAVASAYPRARRMDALGFRRFRLRWVWTSLGVVAVTTVVAVAVEPLLHGGEDQGFSADRWQPEHAGAFAANALVLVLLGPRLSSVLRSHHYIDGASPQQLIASHADANDVPVSARQ